MGIATRIAVRLTPVPPAVVTLLADFTTVEAAAATVSGDHRRRHRPRRPGDDGRQDHRRGGGVRPRRLSHRRGRRAARRGGRPARRRGRGRRPSSAIARDHGARTVRVAADAAERALLWKGRKSAFGAVARIAPNYYLHDAVVPRTRLVEVLSQVYAHRRRATT